MKGRAGLRWVRAGLALLLVAVAGTASPQVRQQAPTRSAPEASPATPRGGAPSGLRAAGRSVTTPALAMTGVGAKAVRLPGGVATPVLAMTGAGAKAVSLPAGVTTPPLVLTGTGP